MTDTRQDYDQRLNERVSRASRKNPPPPRDLGQKVLTAKELSAMRFAPIKYVVPGIIVEGLTILASKPKIGKSWMMLHAAVAVSRGGYTLGDIHCAEGDALYCALEDNLRRLQSRMTKLFGTQEWPDRLSFKCQMPRLAEGGLQQIKHCITAAKNPRLVIIDTFAMVRAPKKRDQGNYEADYDAVAELRAFASQHGVAVVLVHHLRKQDSDDPFDTVSGTLGLTGAADTILVLKRDTNGIVLHGRGRDLIEIEKAVTFNPHTCVWTIEGEIRQVRNSNQRKAILAAMGEIQLPASPAEIATSAGMSHTNVRQLLLKMIDDGTVTKCDYGKYNLVATQECA
jgi:AAA domain-containing protein